MITNYLVSYVFKHKYESTLHHAFSTFKVTTSGRMALKKGKIDVDKVLKSLEENHNAESLVVITNISEVK